MAHLWTPDTCRNGTCLLEMIDGHRGLVAVQRLCPHHATMRAGLASDDALWDAMLSRNRDKNYGRAAAAASLGVDVKTLPFTVGADDRITITTGANANRRAAAQTAVNNAIGANKVIIA